MAARVGVADLKRRFSEYLDSVARDGESVVVRRRGKDVAALVPVGAAPHSRKKPRGLLAAAGAWENEANVDSIIEKIYLARRSARDRPVRIP